MKTFIILDLHAKAEKVIEQLRDLYTGNRDEFDFNVAYFAGCNHNAQLRQEIIHTITGKLEPVNSCTLFRLADVLRNKFNQPQLF